MQKFAKIVKSRFYKKLENKKSIREILSFVFKDKPLPKLLFLFLTFN